MLRKDKIALTQITEKFMIVERQLRETLIRLFFQGKVFGRIDGHFLIFSPADTAIEEIIDWPLSEFDLKSLITEAQKAMQSDTKKTAENELNKMYGELERFGNREVEITRAKESSLVDPVTTETRFLFAGNKLNLRIHLKNVSNNPVTHIRIKVEYPAQIVNVLTVRPELDLQVEGQTIWMNIGDLPAKNGRNVTVVFLEKERGNIFIDGHIQYKSAEGFIRFIPLQHTVYEFQMPTLITGHLSPDAIVDFMKNPDVYQNTISYGLPNSLTPNQAHDFLRTSLKEVGFTIVSEVNQQGILASFMIAQVQAPNEEVLDILCVPQIKDQVILLYAACKNDLIVSNLLRYTSRILHIMLSNEELIPTGSMLVDLNCIKCGAVLGRFPKQGEEISCPFCQTKQMPWH
jgi:hypothetical protein